MSEYVTSHQEFQIPNTKHGDTIDAVISNQDSLSSQTSPEATATKIVSIDELRRLAQSCDYLSNGKNNERDKICSEAALAIFISDSITLAREEKIKQAA